jgi:hypothetical protein
LAASGALPARPVYESPAIVGSTAPLDTGRIELRPAQGRTNRLTLVADAMAYERPSGSDPLDVRDVFDWLEPLVELDEASLKTAVLKHVAEPARAWLGTSPYGEG